MHGNYLNSELRLRLAAFIEARRRDIVVAALRASASAPGTISMASSVFINAFFDRLARELQDGSRDILDLWFPGDPKMATAAEGARLVGIACDVLATAYAASNAGSDQVSKYLARRSAELAARANGEAAAPPAEVGETTSAGRDDAIASLLSALEAHDAATAYHSRAAGIWSGRIAKGLGLDRDEQRRAVLCGTLHDVGKIATPTEILLKPGPLDCDERVDMQAHSLIGARMLERIPALAELAVVVRAHHEKLDGSGYPDALAGDRIPLTARIVSVADAFHAMISKRPYRDALELSRVLEILRAGAGTQWDAQVVDALLSIVRPAVARTQIRRAESLG